MRIVLILAALLLAACTSPESATRVLTSNGYTDVRMTGYNFFACSQDDVFHTGFEAKSPNGTPVKGTVCAGLIFKNSTIRFE